MKKAGITAIPSTDFGSVSYPPEGLIHDFSDYDNLHGRG